MSQEKRRRRLGSPYDQQPMATELLWYLHCQPETALEFLAAAAAERQHLPVADYTLDTCHPVVHPHRSPS